jgi:hypothetical protein
MHACPSFSALTGGFSFIVHAQKKFILSLDEQTFDFFF